MFLRKLLEETATAGGNDSKRTGLQAQNPAYYLNASSFDATGRKVEQILYFMDYHQPIYYEFPLPEGTFHAELLDPWEMKISAVPGTFTGKSKVKLAGQPFQAVRFRRA